MIPHNKSILLKLIILKLKGGRKIHQVMVGALTGGGLVAGGGMKDCNKNKKSANYARAL